MKIFINIFYTIWLILFTNFISLLVLKKWSSITNPIVKCWVAFSEMFFKSWSTFTDKRYTALHCCTHSILYFGRSGSNKRWSFKNVVSFTTYGIYPAIKEKAFGYIIPSNKQLKDSLMCRYLKDVQHWSLLKSTIEHRLAEPLGQCCFFPIADRSGKWYQRSKQNQHTVTSVSGNDHQK